MGLRCQICMDAVAIAIMKAYDGEKRKRYQFIDKIRGAVMKREDPTLTKKREQDIEDLNN